MSADFTHLDNREHPRMVDVSHKVTITERKAVAQAVVRLGEELFELLKEEEYIQGTGFSDCYHCRYSRC